MCDVEYLLKIARAEGMAKGLAIAEANLAVIRAASEIVDITLSHIEKGIDKETSLNKAINGSEYRGATMILALKMIRDKGVDLQLSNMITDRGGLNIPFNIEDYARQCNKDGAIGCIVAMTKKRVAKGMDGAEAFADALADADYEHNSYVSELAAKDLLDVGVYVDFTDWTTLSGIGHREKPDRCYPTEPAVIFTELPRI